jgi:tetratricopeptide (TPR) repeat protein
MPFIKAAARPAWGRREWLLAALLAAATLLTLSPVLGCGFVNYDDPYYVTENVHLRGGLSWAGVSWGFTTFLQGNWHPLVWLSLMLDARLYGVDHPFGFHLTNLLWHTGSALLLFAALRRLTGDPWPSALAAALFAVHPLNVEPVAWVSDRKGVVSTFFAVLTLWAYARYAERPGLGRYLVVALAFVLGLMAKPMLVTVPFVLLLLDYWPLGRLWRRVSNLPAGPAGKLETCRHNSNRPLALLILEKLPLLAVAAGFCVLAVVAQHASGALRSLGDFSPEARLKNAALSYVWYLREAVWPTGLAVFYPHPGDSPSWGQAAAAALLLLAVTALALWGVRRAPYLLVGWLWFVGTLVPVIGIVQVGQQARADRYAYLPLIGLFLMASWGLTGLARRWDRPRLLGAGAGGALACLMAVSWAQAHVWRNSVALWENDLRAGGENYVAHSNLGKLFQDRGEPEKALRHFREAVRLNPDQPQTHFNLAKALLGQRDVEGATRQLEEAVRLDPSLAPAQQGLGNLLRLQGRLAEAVGHLREAVNLDPTSAKAHADLGRALLALGQTEEGAAHVREAERLASESPRNTRNTRKKEDGADSAP